MVEEKFNLPSAVKYIPGIFYRYILKILSLLPLHFCWIISLEWVAQFLEFIEIQMLFRMNTIYCLPVKEKNHSILCHLREVEVDMFNYHYDGDCPAGAKTETFLENEGLMFPGGEETTKMNLKVSQFLSGFVKAS